MILLTTAVASVAAHLWVLGEVTGAALTSFSVLYYTVSVFTTRRVLMWLFMAGSLLLFLLTYEKPIDILIPISSICTLLSIFSLAKKRMQIYQFFGTLTRLVFYSIIFSPVAVLLEFALLISNVTGYWRFYVRQSDVR